MDGAYDVISDASSSEELIDDDLMDIGDQQQHSRPQPQQRQPSHDHRPPPISTAWEESVDETEHSHGAEGQEAILDDVLVSFNNLPNTTNDTIGVPILSSSMVHFQHPNRYSSDFSSPYPTQTARRTSRNAADSVLDQVVIGRTNNHRKPTREEVSPSLSEVTPAFLRRAAQDLGITTSINNATTTTDRGILPNPREPIPPNSLVNRRTTKLGATNNHTLPDSSFYGADASALNGTFVSIRDLDDDDDVPSVDNVQSNYPTTNGKEIVVSDVDFPTEKTSLLGEKSMPWQGGFFGSQIEKEDRRERGKMMHSRNRGLFVAGIRTLRSIWSGGKQTTDRYHSTNRRGTPWEANHPIGNNFMSPTEMHTSRGRLSSRRSMFSRFVIGALCLHLAVCGLHDIFLRYIAYRNPDGGGEAEVSWNGEGRYIPPYWMSFEGRVLNPCVGPGARTLTGFGALVPGLVLSNGQRWRIGTSLFQTSSVVQLLLHIWALRTALGGSMNSLEWRRGTSTVSIVYTLSALIGVVWSITLEPGRLITASGMGIAGLLAAATVDHICFPDASKDEGDDAGMSRYQAGDGGSNVVSSSNEQFSFLPSTSQKKKRRNLLNTGSPSLLLVLELLASWWAAYSSLPGTALSVVAGVTCALLLFVGNPPPDSFGNTVHHDLLFSESLPPPPPPPPLHWRDDDDSADTSVDAGRQFNTPLMRRPIFGDEEDDEEPFGSSSLLRRRHGNGSSVTTPMRKESNTSNIKESFSTSRVLARVVGILLGLLLIVIPASLIATGERPSNEVTRASVLGCRPMRILYKEDDNSDSNFQCAGGCIPLSRERFARQVEGMRPGRCDTVGYRCWQQSGTMTLRNYKVNIGVYGMPSADGCANTVNDDGQGYTNNDDVNTEAAEVANNGEVEGGQ